MQNKLSDKEIELAFNEYKLNKTLTKGQLADRFGVSKRTIWRYFSKKYPSENKQVSRYKSYSHGEKVNKSNIEIAFEIYKNGVSLEELSDKLGITKDSIRARFRRTFKENYYEISDTNQLNNENTARKVSHKEIKNIFNEYKLNKIPLELLAKRLNIAESSLTDRFKNHFKEEYKKVAKSRRDERKVTKEKYTEAFELYEKTPVSLTCLAKMLNISINSLRPRFIRLFGERYHKVARAKLEGNFLNQRGQLAEKFALRYLKMEGIEVIDTRNNCLIKNSLKRPDYVFEETFIEVKSHFIKYSNTRIKGYKQIVGDYLNKELINGKVLKFGIIISLSGFSKRVYEQAEKDGIILIDYQDLKNKFEANKKYNLIKNMEHHFLPN